MYFKTISKLYGLAKCISYQGVAKLRYATCFIRAPTMPVFIRRRRKSSPFPCPTQQATTPPPTDQVISYHKTPTMAAKRYQIISVYILSAFGSVGMHSLIIYIDQFYTDMWREESVISRSSTGTYRAMEMIWCRVVAERWNDAREYRTLANVSTSAQTVECDTGKLRTHRDDKNA